MTVQEAIKQVALLDPYQTRDFRHGTHITTPSGQVTIGYEYQRGIIPCPICGKWTGMGMITVRHVDGRSVAFNPALYHYVDAGHVISDSDFDGDLLIAIMGDA